MKTKSLVAFVSLAGSLSGLLLLAAPAAAAAEFTGLGTLGVLTFRSEAYGVSDDGKVVVGGSFRSSNFSSMTPFRWTQETGMVRLPKLSAVWSSAQAVSADGSVVVGDSRSAFRWTESQGTVNLGSLGGGSMGGSYGVSADGSAVAGWALTSTQKSEPFRYTEQGGMQGLGTLFVGRDSYALGMSADGSTVVGYGGSPNDTSWGNVKRAFRWTETGGIESLGDLPGDTPSSWADDASADGSVVVGVANARADFTFGQAFRWTKPTGMVSLGSIPDGPPLSWAHGVSGDGSRVVGLAFNNPQAGTEVAFLWDEENGMRNLQQVLTDQFDLGASLQGWTLQWAYDISADGQVIVGWGTNPDGQTEGWRAAIGPVPEPSSITLLGIALLGLLADAHRSRLRRA